MRLTTDQQRALAMLEVSPHGFTESILQAHGFTIEFLAEMVHNGLATAESEQVRASRRPINVVRLKITELGRRALVSPREPGRGPASQGSDGG